MIAKAELFPTEYYSADGYDTYENVITAFCAAFGKTAVFRDPGAAWLGYRFYPWGKNITLNNANNFLNLLRQKYLIFACDNGGEEVLFYSCGPAFGAEDKTYTPTNDLSRTYTYRNARYYMWRDENQTVHFDGVATNPIHNLGYLESTDSPPSRNSITWAAGLTVRPDFEIQDGDTFGLTYFGATLDSYALVTEEYTAPDKSHRAPRWFTQIDSNPVFANTEGGALPSTIERVSNYTPVNTSTFNGTLSGAANNVQAALEALDEHTRFKLTLARTYYVDATDGSDTFDGLTALTAFATIQHAVDIAAGLDSNIYDVTIQLADDSYAENVTAKNMLGAGKVIIQGNAATPANVAWTGRLWKLNAGTIYYVKDVKFIGAATTYVALYAQNGAYIQYSNINFSSGFTVSHLLADFQGFIEVLGAYTISANVPEHAIVADGAAWFSQLTITVTLSGTPAWSAQFVRATACGTVTHQQTTYSGACTGRRYRLELNAVMRVQAASGTYFPGNAPGANDGSGMYGAA
jgi:hypothetical protein